ncbi:hypothetical protein GUITHDRAFT_61824, partial [Guillardia theta CCMP2712]
QNFLLVTDAHMLSRLLYPNPVCILSVCCQRTSSEQQASQQDRNVMVLSWLTATDNYGSFICSVKRSRHSLSLMLTSRKFVLGVPVHGMEEVLRQMGGESGRDSDKIAKLGL